MRKPVAYRLRAWTKGMLLFAVFQCAAPAHELSVQRTMQFVPPQPGSYTLQKIMHAPEGMVLGLDARPRRLSRYIAGKVTLLSFVYTACTDPNGCPLAYWALQELKQEIQKKPGMQQKVRFVSLSFDPQHDKPAVMRLYGGSHASSKDGFQWYFLTTRTSWELMPLLKGFGQDVSVLIDPASGKPVPVLSHVLKVFLIDRKGEIREIYTTSFLLPQIVLNDIQTLLLEDSGVN
jgi:cytochrome oxidase Cu insertion factor (SCO1/SenC/PrrC family)